jgi:hypothetical protein
METVQRSPSTNIARTDSWLGNSQTSMRKTVRGFGLCPFHIQNVLAVPPVDHFARGEFYHWLLRNQIPCTKFYSQTRLSSTRMEYQIYQFRTSGPLRRKNLMQSQTHFQTRFSVNFRAVLSDRLNLKMASWQAKATDTFTGRAATAVVRRVSEVRQGDVAKAKWRTRSFRWYWLSQSTVSSP